MRLIALREIPRSGQRYMPGDEFDMRNPIEARALIATRRAMRVGDVTANEVREQAGLPPIDEREALRARATALGIDVDKRWGVVRLEEEIASAEEAAASSQKTVAQEAPVAQEPEPEQQDEPEPEPEQPEEQAAIDTQSYSRRDMQAEGER